MVKVMDFVHVCMCWSTTPEHTCKRSHTLFCNIQWPNSGQNTHKIIKNLVKISIMFILCIHLHDQTRWEWYNLDWIKRAIRTLALWKWGLFFFILIRRGRCVRCWRSTCFSMIITNTERWCSRRWWHRVHNWLTYSIYSHEVTGDRTSQNQRICVNQSE